MILGILGIFIYSVKEIRINTSTESFAHFADLPRSVHEKTGRGFLFWLSRSHSKVDIYGRELAFGMLSCRLFFALKASAFLIGADYMANTTLTVLTDKIDTTGTTLYNEDAVRQIAQEAAQQAVADFVNRIISGGAMLDNSIPQTQSYSDDNRLTLTVQEVADLIGISKPVAYGLINDGSIRSIRVGRKILVPRQAVTDYLAN